MKNKILSYLLGSIIVLSTWFITSYVDAQWDEDCESSCAVAGMEGKAPCIAECEAKKKEQTGWWCDCSGITDSKAQYECMQQCSEKGKKECKGIKLNTNFPGIWKCIETSKDAKTNPTNAFPTMIWTLTRIIISFVLVGCFIMIIVGWIMRAWDKPKEWKDLITKVAITILLLWFSWVILRLINPNFFG